MAGFLEEEEYHRERDNRRLQKEAADRLTVAIRTAIERFGSIENARDFLNSGNSLLGGLRPLDVARTDRDGLDRVTGLINRLGNQAAIGA